VIDATGRAGIGFWLRAITRTEHFVDAVAPTLTAALALIR